MKKLLPLSLFPLVGTLLLGACSDQGTPTTDAQQEAAPTVSESAPAAEGAPKESLTEKAKKLADDASDLGSSAWEATKEETGELMLKGKDAIGDAADATGEAVDAVKQKSAGVYGAVKEKSVEAYGNVKEKGAEVYDSVKEKAGEALDTAKEKMQPETPEVPEAPSDLPREI